MSREYSVAEARNHLSRVIRDAETSGPVRITRRGKSAVVVLSERDYAELSSPPHDFWTALQAFRAECSPDGLHDSGLDLTGLRDRSPGRGLDL